MQEHPQRSEFYKPHDGPGGLLPGGGYLMMVGGLVAVVLGAWLIAVLLILLGLLCVSASAWSSLRLPKATAYDGLAVTNFSGGEPADSLDLLRDRYLGDDAADTLDYLLAVEAPEDSNVRLNFLSKPSQPLASRGVPFYPSKGVTVAGSHVSGCSSCHVATEMGSGREHRYCSGDCGPRTPSDPKRDRDPFDPRRVRDLPLNGEAHTVPWALTRYGNRLYLNPDHLAVPDEPLGTATMWVKRVGFQDGRMLFQVAYVDWPLVAVGTREPNDLAHVWLHASVVQSAGGLDVLTYSGQICQDGDIIPKLPIGAS